MPRGRLAAMVAATSMLLAAAPARAADTPDQVGQWGPVMDWPLVAVHTSVLSSGKVLVWDGFEAGPNSQRVWDPATGLMTLRPYARNLFCSGFSQLSDGKLFIAGGHVSVNNGLRDSTLWDPLNDTATRVADLANARWYPTVTTLADGRALVFSGDNIQADDTPPGNPLSFKSSTLPEVYDPATNSYARLTSARLDTPLYPFMFVLPDGRVFDAGPDRQSHILNPSGTGTMSNGPVSPFDGSSAAMYAPGKVIKSGTWSDPSFANIQTTGRTAVIDMNAPSPAWRETAPMAYPRAFETITMLPDGSPLVTGGTQKSDGVDLTTAILPAERWDPETETWTTMAAQAKGRGYHSTAVLLPDARVLVAGGGQLPGYPVTNQTNAQIFSPPYLFKGVRPQILQAPGLVQPGRQFTVNALSAGGVGKVSLVRLGSMTHNFDQNQRFVPLSFSADAGTLTVDAPANTNVAPPGYYMLFVVDANGVPSVASMVRIPAATEDSVPPGAPGTLTAAGGLGRVDLSWGAATDNGSIRRYNVHRGTTPGFTPTTANRIAQPAGTSYSDTGLAAGTYYYRVTAEDLAGNVGQPSNEASAAATADTTAPSVSISAPAAGATVTGAVTVSASASDDVAVAGVQFKLDGANLGAEDTSAPYSVSWDSQVTANGTHTLTAVARDGSGNARTSAAVGVTVANTAAGPVLALGFEEPSGTAVTDSSGKGNNGTIAGGAVRTAAGKNGAAITFDGVNDMVTVPDANTLDLTSAMTLEAWVRPTAQSSWRTALLKETSGDLVYALYSSSAYGGVSAARPSSWIAAENVGSTTALPANAWSHLAVTYDRANWRLYVNGTQVATRAYTAAIPTSTGALRIGGNSIWGEWFAGQIDDVRVYGRTLSAAEVAADRDTGVGGGAPPPPDTQAPTATVTAPAAGTVTGSVSVSATASDNVGVGGVQFKLDGTNLGSEDTSAPYSITWDTKTAGNGPHTITAVARDAAGNAGTSAGVDVSVANDVTAPGVALTAPADGATVNGTIPVSANAADDTAVAGVQFKLDGANLGSEDTSAPYSVNWNTTSATSGDHTLAAVARDPAGNQRTSASVTVTVANDATAPTVSITSPADGATVSGLVDVTADAADAVGVSGVQFKLDGANLGSEDTTAPYSVSWNATANGPHTLTAVARDAAGNSRTSAAVDVTVADTTAPTVSITAPPGGATVSGTLNVTASAADAVGVAGVRFRLDGDDLGSEDTSAPYSVGWDTKAAGNGPHTLTAVARDAAGNSRTSAAVDVTVDNDVTAPTVSISAPADATTVSGTLNVTADAADAVGVSGVQFRLDGATLGAEDTSAPYAVSWNTTTAGNGPHALTAVARDAVGNSRTSATVSVTVTNTAPPPPSGLAAAYAFDEPSGPSVGDASGKGNLGTISGATRTPGGHTGGALTFDGVNDMVTVPDANSLDLTGAMTLEAWVRPTAQSDYRTAIIKETSGNLVYALYSSSAFGGSGVQRPSAWLGAQGLGATAALPTNAWTHIATTYDRVTWRLYVNGVQVATRAYTTAIATSTGALRIGGNSIWGEWFAGQIDDVRVYGRAVSAAEVAADRDAPVAP